MRKILENYLSESWNHYLPINKGDHQSPSLLHNTKVPVHTKRIMSFRNVAQLSHHFTSHEGNKDKNIIVLVITPKYKWYSKSIIDEKI